MSQMPAVTEWDFEMRHEHTPPCPVCGQLWPKAPPVYVSEDSGVALVGVKAFRVTPTQSRVLQVLASSYGRYMQPEDVLWRAFSDRPDSDIPKTLSPVSTSLHKLRQSLRATGYKIEFRRAYGYRFIHDEDTKRVRSKTSEQGNRKTKSRRKSVSNAKPKRVARKKVAYRGGAKRREERGVRNR